MAFAQLAYRESLGDIEVCLIAAPQKLYHMGFTGPVARSTLADANERRDWRIYTDSRICLNDREPAHTCTDRDGGENYEN